MLREERVPKVTAPAGQTPTTPSGTRPRAWSVAIAVIMTVAFLALLG